MIRDTLFSVILCTADRPDSTGRATLGVLRQARVCTELWVMDQSTGPETEMRTRTRFGNDSRVHYVRIPKKGKARAANLAAREARGRYLVFIDDDCEPVTDWLITIEKHFRKEPELAALVGNLDSRPILFWAFCEAGYNPPAFHADSPSDFVGIGSCPGGNMAVRKDIYLAIGGMDEALGPGAPFGAAVDQDLIYRLLVHGFPVAKDPNLLVRHWPARTGSWRSAISMGHAYTLGAIAFCLKHVRCGDTNALCLFFRMVTGRQEYFARGIFASIFGNRSNRRVNASFFVILCLMHPFWILDGFLRASIFPLSKKTRLFQKVGTQ